MGPPDGPPDVGQERAGPQGDVPVEGRGDDRVVARHDHRSTVAEEERQPDATPTVRHTAVRTSPIRTRLSSGC